MFQNKSRIDRALAGRKQEPGGAQSIRETDAPQRRAAQPPADGPGEFEGDERFNEVVEELAALVREGGLPEGCDLETLCREPALLELIWQYPADAAVRIFLAEKRAGEAEQNARQNVSDRMRSRKGLPQSTRGGAMAAPRPDYRNMKGEDFRAVLSQVKRTARNGGTARL